MYVFLIKPPMAPEMGHFHKIVGVLKYITSVSRPIPTKWHQERISNDWAGLPRPSTIWDSVLRKHAVKSTYWYAM